MTTSNSNFRVAVKGTTYGYWMEAEWNYVWAANGAYQGVGHYISSLTVTFEQPLRLRSRELCTSTLSGTAELHQADDRWCLHGRG